MKLSTSRILISAMLLAILPVLALQAPTQAATTRLADGQSQATAAGSCWEIKQNNPSSTNGIYWLVTPALQAPQQFYCDQTTSGGGWVLVGRGRQGWKPYYDGLGTAAQVRDTVTGPAAFSPAQLTSHTVDGLLNNTKVSSLADGVRLRRAGDRAGSTWQEVRFKIPSRDRWAWTFASMQAVGAYSFTGAGVTGTVSGTGGQVNSFGTGQTSLRVNTSAVEAQGFLWGFSYGTTGSSTLNGTTDPSSYIWSAVDNTNSGRPFTQMFIRPQLKRTDMYAATTVPDTGTAKQEQRALPDSNATRTVWGVNGLADGIDGELHAEVQSFAQVGGTVFVGGNFKYVQKDATGTGQVQQPDLAGFDVNTGEFIPGFDPVFNGQVKAVEALPDGRLAVGGEFTTVNGVAQPGLAFLDPATGALSGTQTHVETRNGAGTPFVRGLDSANGYLYVAGSFTHMVSGTTVASDWNGGRVNLSTSRPDTNWNPLMNGTSVGVNATARSNSAEDRVYFAGYFSTVKGNSQVDITALQPTAGAAQSLPGWQAKSSTDVANRLWQLDVQEVGDRFYYGGSQHSLFGYDRNNMDAGVKSGTIMLSGGDVQTVTANSDTVFAGCHCGDFAYQDAYTYPTPTGFTQADSINTFGAWDAPTGKFLPDFNPIVKGRKGYGAWGMFNDSKGNLWVGGDYATSIRAGYVNQWSGGFMRFAPRDAQAPTSPSNLASTNIDASTFKLSWTGSNDNVGGALTYEVIEGNRVIATTTSTSVNVTRLTGTQKYFVRAVDVAGNRSASTDALSVTDPSNQPPPAAPVVTGQVLSPTSIRLTWPSQVAAGGFIVKRDGAQVGTRPSGSTSYDDTGLAEGTKYTYTVTAVDDIGQQTDSAPVDVTTTTSTPETQLVQSTTPWRWRFASTAPDSGWQGGGFDDSTWTSSTGPFGFGTALANTDISVGAPSPRPLSAQFRTTFEVPEVNNIDAPELTFVADDGVVVYVNGVEVTRKNLPTGNLTPNTYATAAPRSATANANPVVVTVPKSALHDGTNVIAAETHVNYRGTPDALFRATMTATPADPGNPPPPAAPQVSGSATSSTSIELTWPDQSDATGGFIVKRGTTQIGTPPVGATSFEDTGLTAGTTYTYTVTAVDSIGQQTSSAPVDVTTSAAPAQGALVDANATWRWRFQSTAPDSAWKSVAFDDSTWTPGTGAFGFGTALANNDISVGAPSPRPLSAQFRTTFEVPDIGAVGSPTLTFVADDGVVVYINGVEIRRQNIADGVTITNNTYANAAPRSTTANANPVVIPATALQQGTNVIAAETHVNYRATPDALFRLTLSSTP